MEEEREVMEFDVLFIGAGVHVAMRSGMLAAETILNSLLSEDFSESALLQYEDALYKSDVGKDLYKSRNFHQAFKKASGGDL